MKQTKRIIAVMGIILVLGLTTGCKTVSNEQDKIADTITKPLDDAHSADTQQSDSDKRLQEEMNNNHMGTQP